MSLKTPSAPYEPVYVHGESVTLDTSGKVLVLPSGNSAVLPSFNEYTLNSNRLSIAESPFGGLKGSGSPDYSVGTVYTPTDDVYLTDTSGTNSTKTLTGGKLKELSLMTVDPVGHTITQDFEIVNTAESNNPTSIATCDSTALWASSKGNIELNTTDKQEGTGCISNTCHTASDCGSAYIPKGVWDLSTSDFIKLSLKGVAGKTLRFILQSTTNYIYWDVVADGNWQKIVLPLRKPRGAVGTISLASVSYLIVYTLSAAIGDICLIDNITADTGKSAYIELQTPDNIQNTTLQCWTGTAYETVRIDSLNSAYSNISGDTTKLKMLDGTLFNDVHGVGLGRAVFPKGTAEETKDGSTGSITYSANRGTKNRIGYMFSLPPSDGGRTDFNKLKLRVSYPYTDDGAGNYSASQIFADSTNASYGLQNVIKPWIALYDPTSNLIDFYLFTYRPKNLEFKRDESGTIYEVTLYPGNGLIYYGQIHYSDLSNDSDSNDIPDCLDASVEGSVTKFLQSYGMVI